MRKLAIPLISLLIVVGCNSPASKPQNTPANNEEVNNTQTIPEEDSNGLSTATKKEIFKAIGDSEEKARVESETQFSIPDPSKAGYTQENANSAIDKQLDLQIKLNEKYKAKILEEYEISEETYFAIMTEGVRNNWD